MRSESHTQEGNHHRATHIGLIAPLCWGFYPVLILSLGAVPVFFADTLLFLLGTGVIVSVAVMRRVSLIALCRQPGVWKSLALSVYGFLGLNIFYVLALRHAPAAEAFLIMNTWQILAIFLARCWLKTPLYWWHKVGGICGFLGVVLLALARGELSLNALSLGHLYALLSCVTWASYSVCARRMPSVSPETTGLALFLCAVVTGVISWCFELWSMPSVMQIKILLLIGIFPIGVAYYAWNYAVQKGDIRILSLGSYVGVLMSACLLIAYGYAELSWHLIMAFGLIMGGACVGTLMPYIRWLRQKLRA